LQVAIGHVAIEGGIGESAAGTCQQDRAANDRSNGTLHEMA
jgi:hypothetical protein